MHNGLIRCLVLPAGAALMLVAGVPAQAQWHTVSRSRLDSLANPPMAEGREAMAFERTTVTAEPRAIPSAGATRDVRPWS